MNRVLKDGSVFRPDRSGRRACAACQESVSRSSRRKTRAWLRTRSSGQMTVELAVVFPVLLIVGFISVNAFVFLGDCAAFDVVARDAIRLQADDGNREAQGCAEICARIEKGLSMNHETVSVTSERTAAGHIRYVAKTAFAPPFLKGVRVFGVVVPMLEHEVAYTISPYRAGVIA